MKQILFSLILAVPLVALGSVYGQQATSADPFSERQITSGWGVNVKRMYEDIEIFRRILDNRLHQLMHGPGHDQPQDSLWIDFDSDGRRDLLIANPHGPASNEVRPLFLFRNKGNGLFEQIRVVPSQPSPRGLCTEGTFVRGYGVFLDVSIPVHFHEITRLREEVGEKPLSEWERTRRSLRGEKNDAQPKGRASQPESLTDAILKVLAENGRHFTELGMQERLTVSVTLRQAQESNCMVCHRAISGRSQLPAEQTNSAGSDRGASEGVREVLPANQLGDRSGAAGAAAGQGSPAELPLSGEAANQALLGDLHLKQARCKEAAAAYEKALSQLEQNENDLLKRRPDRAASQRTLYDLAVLQLYSKLAEAQFGSGDQGGRRRTLQRMAERASRSVQTSNLLANKTSRLAGPSGQGTPADPSAIGAPAPLPAKLIISVTRKTLDDLAGGRFGDIRKVANVEFLDFSDAKPGPQKSSGQPGGKQGGSVP